MIGTKLLVGASGTVEDRPRTHMFLNRGVTGAGANDQHYFYRLENNGENFVQVYKNRQWTGYDDITGITCQYDPHTQRLVVVEYGIILATPPSTNHTRRYLKTVYDVSDADNPSVYTSSVQSTSQNHSRDFSATPFNEDGYFYTIQYPATYSKPFKVTNTGSTTHINSVDDPDGFGYTTDNVTNVLHDPNIGFLLCSGQIQTTSVGSPRDYIFTVDETDYDIDDIEGHDATYTPPVNGDVMAIDTERQLVFTYGAYDRAGVYNGGSNSYKQTMMCFDYSNPASITFKSEVKASVKGHPSSPNGIMPYDAKLRRVIVFGDSENGGTTNTPYYLLNVENPTAISIQSQGYLSGVMDSARKRLTYDPQTNIGHFIGEPPFQPNFGELHKFTVSSTGISFTYNVGTNTAADGTSANSLADGSHINCLYA